MSEETVFVVTDLPAKSSVSLVRKLSIATAIGLTAAAAVIVAKNKWDARLVVVENTETPSES